MQKSEPFKALLYCSSIRFEEIPSPQQYLEALNITVDPFFANKLILSRKLSLHFMSGAQGYTHPPRLFIPIDKKIWIEKTFMLPLSKKLCILTLQALDYGSGEGQ